MDFDGSSTDFDGSHAQEAQRKQVCMRPREAEGLPATTRSKESCPCRWQPHDD